jgi:hypothetical protein
MKPEDWPVGATFTYNSPYGPTSWIGIVASAHVDDGLVTDVKSTRGGFYGINQINLETKEDFISRVREKKLKDLGI